MDAPRSRYLQGPLFDGAFFIGAPLLSLLLGFAFSRVPEETNSIFFLDQPTTLTGIALRTIIHSHLVIVVFRSHLNRTVFARHPWRFTLVPIAIFIAMMASLPLLAVIIVITTYWDAYHSSMQTFGIGRIYGMKAGADAHAGRAWDIWLNHVIYLGPMMAGPLWLALAQCFDVMHVAGVDALDPVRDAFLAAQPFFRWTFFIGGPLFVAVYTWQAVARHRAGEPVSWQKYALFATTAVTSVWAWGFNSFGQALLVVNTFHSVQYFAIVWWSERDHLGKTLGTDQMPGGRAWAAIVIVTVGVLYGFWFSGVSSAWAPSGLMKHFVVALTNLVALMHFWYDGFVWSVRRREI